MGGTGRHGEARRGVTQLAAWPWWPQVLAQGLQWKQCEPGPPWQTSQACQVCAQGACSPANKSESAVICSALIGYLDPLGRSGHLRPGL